MPKATFEPAEEVHFETVTYNQPDEKTDAESKADALADALREDNNAFCVITKEMDNGPSQHCGRVPADKFDFGQLLEHLKTTYGGGDYRIRVYAKGKITANKLVSIAKSINGNLPAVRNVGNEVEGILTTVLDRLDRMNAQPQPSRREFFEEMLLMKQLFDGGQQNSTPLGEVLGLVKDLQKIGLVPKPEEPEEKDGVMGFLGQVSEPLMQILQGVAQTPPQKAPVATQPQKQPQPAGEPVIPKIDPRLMFIKSQLQPVIKAAAKNSDASLYCDVVLDQIPETFLPQFVGLLEKENWFDELVAIEKKVEPHKEWFALLRDEILLAFAEDEETGCDSEADTTNIEQETDDLPNGEDS
jgi:hypothetical protein